LSQRLDPST